MSTHVNKRGQGGGRWRASDRTIGEQRFISLLICICNVVWWNKNVKTTFQEERVKKTGCLQHLQVSSRNHIQELTIAH